MTREAGEVAASAGSKVILLGEHAVVHGKDALAVGLARGVKVVARRTGGPVGLRVPRWDLHASVDGGAPGDRALAALVGALGVPVDGVQLEATPHIPPRAGLGSSASLAAACARCLVELHGAAVSAEQFFAAVMASEQVFHTNPSGVDAHAVMHEGCLLFNKRDGIRPLDVAPPPLMVVHSGVEGATARTVEAFGVQLRQEKCFAQNRLAYIQSLVERGTAALKGADLPALGNIMNENHKVLQWFGVSCPELDEICRIALGCGALGAKMTGGGGGGCAIVLPGDQKGAAAIENALDAAGFGMVS